MADKPLWRKAFDEVDRRVAGPVEAGAHSDLFGDLVTLNAVSYTHLTLPTTPYV